MDRRKRRYVPLSVTFAHGDTGSYILKHLGRDGLLVWICLIAAVKRGEQEGTFEWISEEDAWRQLGIADPATLAFTFEEFLAVTGRIKQTRKTRNRAAGHCQHAVLTRWGDWNDDWRRETEAGRKSWNRQGKARDTSPPMRGRYRNGTRTEVEVDLTPSPYGTNNGSPWSCSKCGLAFTTERRLTEHMENVHDQPLKEATA